MSPSPVSILTVQDVGQIPPELLPMIVLSDNLFSWFSWRIKCHSKGYYNHAFTLWRPGWVASQNWRMEEQPIFDYVNREHRVKFWHCPGWSNSKREWMKRAIVEDLTEKGRYDWLGIIGQAIKWDSLNSGKRHYCSEQVGDILRIAEPGFNLTHPTPADIDSWCRATPQMECYGVFDPNL